MTIANPIIPAVVAKAARFHNTVYINEIPSVSTYSVLEKQMCWYTKDDYRSFKLNMFLERTSLTIQQPPPPPPPMRSMVLDGSPCMPQRSASPEPEQRTRMELPSSLPLFNNNDNDDDDEPSDHAREHQILMNQTMRERLRKLRAQRQQESEQSTRGRGLNQKRKLKHRSPAQESLRNRYGERQPVSPRSDSLDTSVRQYVPFPEDDNDRKLRVAPTKNILPERYAFEHPLFNPPPSCYYYPTKSLERAAHTAMGGNSNKHKSIDSILDSADRKSVV